MSNVLTEDDLARRAAELAKRAESDRPPAWIPDKAAENGHPVTLSGIVEGYEHGQSAFGPRQIAIVREPVAGRRWSVWLHGAVLQSEFAEQAPQPGELIAISYLGRRQRKNPQAGTNPEYEAYRLVVDRATSAPTAVEPPAALLCEQCGFADGEHAAGCIPF